MGAMVGDAHLPTECSPPGLGPHRNLTGKHSELTAVSQFLQNKFSSPSPLQGKGRDWGSDTTKTALWVEQNSNFEAEVSLWEELLKSRPGI